MHSISLNRYTINIDGEHNSGELITVPDQSLSVREILSRFRRGLLNPNDLVKNAKYNEACESEFDADFTEEVEDLAEIYGLAQEANENDT